MPASGLRQLLNKKEMLNSLLLVIFLSYAITSYLYFNDTYTVSQFSCEDFADCYEKIALFLRDKERFITIQLIITKNISILNKEYHFFFEKKLQLKIIGMEGCQFFLEGSSSILVTEDCILDISRITFVLDNLHNSPTIFDVFSSAILGLNALVFNNKGIFNIPRIIRTIGCKKLIIGK